MSKTKDVILKKIKDKKIKIKPRWKFVAEDVGIRTVVAIGLLGAAIALSTIGFFLDLYNPKDLAEFGEVGWQLFKEDFPYFWLISAIGLGIAGWFLEPKIGSNYKKSSRFWTIITLVTIAFLTFGIIILRNLLKI
jgi:hypothetical protein